MSKGKEKTKSNKISTTEWLRVSKKLSDPAILRHLLSNAFHIDFEKQTLDPALFEKTYDLGAVPRKIVSADTIESVLGLGQETLDLQIAMSKRTPKGTALIPQIQSLLPNNVNRRERESFTYALSRIITERFPKNTRWPIVPVGLDTLSASLLQLFIISKAVDQRIPWIIAIWKTKIREAKIVTLDTIQELLSQKRSPEEIEESLTEANEIFNATLSLIPKLENQDPFSNQISDWIADLTVAEDKDLQDTLDDIKKEVREAIAEIKEHNKSLKENINVQSDPATNWNNLSLRSDGPVSDEHRALLRLLRMEFNILRYDPIRKLCINLAHVETPNHPSVVDLMQVSEFAGRNAYNELHRLQLLFNEFYIPNFGKIGLRYRYIFADSQRAGVDSEGLVEKLEFIEDDIRSCTIHLEPSWSEGPDIRLFSGKFNEAVVEDEIVSLNLNHYDLKKCDWTALKYGASHPKQKDSLLIQRSTQTENKKPFSLSPRQTELLGILWSLEGPDTHRNWLLDEVNYRRQTANLNLGIMLENEVLRLLYLPALEFCKLPDGLVAYANCSDRKSRDRLVNHIIESQPFSRIHLGDTNDVVAHIRSPSKQSDTVAGSLNGKMQEFSDNHFTARMQERRTYKIPVFHRLLDPKTRMWRNPW
ncbi:hypothetical protein E4H12_05130 [Candidatus Thorarchaeota archaeon]|nr:MAG: hypothetical protein E4H12_05130 [Candidatus Thorarchaeota archaeon]